MTLRFIRLEPVTYKNQIHNITNITNWISLLKAKSWMETVQARTFSNFFIEFDELSKIPNWIHANIPIPLTLQSFHWKKKKISVMILEVASK